MYEIQDLFAKSIVFELQKWFIPKNKWQLTLQGGHVPLCPPLSYGPEWRLSQEWGVTRV